MDRISALVAAAGRGTRAGLPYPKTLYPVQGRPILLRILDLFAPYDDCPTVVVSPEGMGAVRDCLEQHHRASHLVLQDEPRGMGDAVLAFLRSPACPEAEHVLLTWGDIPLIQPDTVAGLVDCHLRDGNDFTMVTRHVDAAYTLVERDADGGVAGVRESREAGITAPGAGERDIGLFVFRKQCVLDALREPDPEKTGAKTGEHGFLYVIGKLAREGRRVVALPIAHELDLVSLNALSDLDGHV